MDSSAIRLSKVWIFGDLWCSIWLAVDVWMCTASILNLCAISLDRYLAVTRPVSYPQASTIYRLFDFVEQVYDETLDEAICPLLGYSPHLYTALCFCRMDNEFDVSSLEWLNWSIELLDDRETFEFTLDSLFYINSSLPEIGKIEKIDVTSN